MLAAVIAALVVLGLMAAVTAAGDPVLTVHPAVATSTTTLSVPGTPSPAAAVNSVAARAPDPTRAAPSDGDTESSPSATRTPTSASFAFPIPAAPQGWEVAGRSVQGSSILVGRFGKGPFKVLWLGGMHGDEIEGSVATANLPAAFEAAGLGDRVTLVIVWDANPDGRTAHTRTNSKGVDLNRDFPATSFGYGATSPTGRPPLSQPETRVVHDLVMKEQPDLIVACHAWRGDQFINYDGPGAARATHFGQLSGFPVKTTDQLGGRYDGSLGHWSGVDMGIASLTIEWLRGTDPVRAWETTRAAIITAITP